MKVRAASREHEDWWKSDADYLVLAVLAKPGSALQLLVLDDDGLPAPLTPGPLVLDGSIPSNWAISVDGDGTMIMQPRAWNEVGFWSAFWDEWSPVRAQWGPSRAREVYDQELARMASEEP